MKTPFKMKGYSYPGKSPVKLTDEEKQANLLKIVPNKEAFDKLSDINKKGFTEAGIKAGLPTKKSPAERSFRAFPSDFFMYSNLPPLEEGDEGYEEQEKDKDEE